MLVAQSLNGELVWLYWQIGSRLRLELVGDTRAESGQGLMTTVTNSLTAEFGRGAMPD